MSETAAEQIPFERKGRRFFALLAPVQPLETWQWRKVKDSLVLRRDGRWGPKWLHRLVLRIARNLGMLGNHTALTLDMRYARLDTEDIRERVERAIAAFMRSKYGYSYSPDDLEIVVGPEEFRALKAAPRYLQGRMEVRCSAGYRVSERSDSSRARSVPFDPIAEAIRQSPRPTTAEIEIREGVDSRTGNRYEERLYTWEGIRLRLVPWLSGLAILPLENDD